MVALAIGHAPTFSIAPEWCIKAYSPIFTCMWAIGFTRKNDLPSLYSVSSSDFSYRLLLFTEHVSWRCCDHLWDSNRVQSIWWPETWWLYYAWLWRDGRKVHILFSKAFLWFFPFKVWYHTNMLGRDYATPPSPSPSYTCCSHHWEWSVSIITCTCPTFVFAVCIWL